MLGYCWGVSSSSRWEPGKARVSHFWGGPNIKTHTNSGAKSNTIPPNLHPERKLERYVSMLFSSWLSKLLRGVTCFFQCSTCKGSGQERKHHGLFSSASAHWNVFITSSISHTCFSQMPAWKTHVPRARFQAALAQSIWKCALFNISCISHLKFLNKFYVWLPKTRRGHADSVILAQIVAWWCWGVCFLQRKTSLTSQDLGSNERLHDLNL